MIHILVGELADGQWFAQALNMTCTSATREGAIAALKTEIPNLKLGDQPVKSIDTEIIEL